MDRRAGLLEGWVVVELIENGRVVHLMLSTVTILFSHFHQNTQFPNENFVRFKHTKLFHRTIYRSHFGVVVGLDGPTVHTHSSLVKTHQQRGTPELSASLIVRRVVLFYFCRLRVD